MELKDILAIGGKSGLYKFVSQAKNGIIVEGLQDKKRIPAYATDKVSALEDIAVFTGEGEVTLAEVLVSIFKKTQGGAAISHKSEPGELKNFFAEVLPDYDREKVYVSDIKKVISWYNLLHEMGLVDGELPKKEEKEEKKEKEGEKEQKKESKPAAKKKPSANKKPAEKKPKE
ncbi:MAG: DUF5606 domain-containing protein [Bacteroidales bacterium]|nr:DUF5606 domain-containing protein [Bacteroidales bacterium]